MLGIDSPENAPILNFVLENEGEREGPSTNISMDLQSLLVMRTCIGKDGQIDLTFSGMDSDTQLNI